MALAWFGEVNRRVLVGGRIAKAAEFAVSVIFANSKMVKVPNSPAVT